MKRSRSTGDVWPLIDNVECSIVVRLKVCHEESASARANGGEPTHANAVLASCGDDLAAVELEAGDRVVVADRVRDGTRSKVPDLLARGV